MRRFLASPSDAVLDGLQVRRVVDRSHRQVPEHAHDWPVISIFVMGSYRNETEIGEAFISGPSVVFYRSGAAHRNTIGGEGFEQVEIEFDPAWLGRSFLPSVPVRRWIGGEAPAILHARSASQLREALRRFLARENRVRESAGWLDTISQRLKADTTLTVKELARGVARHPSWVGTAYRNVTGEGLPETAARFRVERAARLLRETDHPYARIALEAGFCDQSHMNRTFRRVLRRLPTEVRDDRSRFR